MSVGPTATQALQTHAKFLSSYPYFILHVTIFIYKRSCVPSSLPLILPIHSTKLRDNRRVNMSRISPEKSKFAQTCNLLSHYVKEKGSLRDLNIDINGGVSAHNNVKPMNLFPQYATMQDAIRITSSGFVKFSYFSCSPFS